MLGGQNAHTRKKNDTLKYMNKNLEPFRFSVNSGK